MIALLLTTLLATTDELTPRFATFVDEKEAATLGKGARGNRFVVQQIARNLDEKRAMGLPMTPKELRATVVEYERFKHDVATRSGVFPKRYFGYLDGKWDTAARESELRDTVRKAVRVVNALQQSLGRAVRVNDAEIAVTFLAEGGALLLGPLKDRADQVHPVYGIGLDDIALGTAQHPELIAALDAALGTGLGGIVVEKSGTPVLARLMTFREAIAGTALMWLWEKERADRMLREARRVPIMQRALDEQFIIGSLVYNSGILFSEERVRMIRTFSTGKYLAKVSKQSAKTRPELPLFSTELADYPEQPTSWNAVYHVLQRYGAWVALHRFTTVFGASGQFE